MNSNLENTVANLLVPDNKIIAQATQDLKVFLKQQDAVPSLFQLLASQKPEVRQYAAILLRRKILKLEHWVFLSQDVKKGIKQNIFEVFMKETLIPTKKSILHLISTIASHDLSEGLWPELFQLIEQLVSSTEDKQIETGMSVLSCVASTCGADLASHLASLLSLCTSALQHTTNHMVPYHAIVTITHLLDLLETSKESHETMQSLILPMVEVIKKISTIDQTKAAECLGVFEDLIAMDAPFLTPHLPALLTFLVQAGKDESLENVLRVKCLDIICDFIEKNKKMIVRKNLIRSLMEEMFLIMCQQQQADEDDFDESAACFASHVFYKMSLNLPPEKFMFTLTKLTEEAFTCTEARVRAAAYVAVGVSTEGCSETMKAKEMKKFLKQVYTGMSDPDQDVRSAAMFTLGEFSNYLQPNISKFSKDLIPLLFDCLSKQTFDGHTCMQHINRTYYALERFCENLGKDIVPYLSVLMAFFLDSIHKSDSLKIKELSISALGAFALSAEEEIMPYLPKLLEVLKPFLEPTTDEQHLKLQVKTIETLSLLVESLKEVHKQLAVDCMSLALSLLQQATDPDLKASIFGMFGSCSVVLKEAMAPHLPTILPLLILSLKSTEGIIENYEDEDVKKVSELFDDEGEKEEEGSCHANPLNVITSIQLQNAYLYEKGASLEAVGVLSANTGACFLPYLEDSHVETMDLLTFPDVDVRKEAAETAGKLCVAAHKASEQDREGVSGMIRATVEVLLRMAREDEEREVVTGVFEALNEMLKQSPTPVLSSVASVDVFFTLVTDAIKYKLKCQETSLEDEDDEEEYDALLIETAGDLIPCLATVSAPEHFNSFLQTNMPIFVKKHKSSKVCDRSFAVGALAETVKEMGPRGWQFGRQVYPMVMASLTDEDEEVRSNAAFGVGALAISGNPDIHSHYEEMLKGLSRLMSKETDAMVLDNACAALARIVSSNATLVPVAELLPTILGRLPLQEDKEENDTVLDCLLLLISQQNPHALSMLPQILVAVGNMGNAKLTPEQVLKVQALVKEVYSTSPQSFQAIPPEHTKAIDYLQKFLQ